MKLLKHIAFVISIILLSTSIVYLFFTNEWEYTRPTAVPHAYHPVQKGAVIPVDQRIAGLSQQPVFLHFYNPSCKCSRFNRAHVRQLAARYGKSLQFVVVIPSVQPKLNVAAIAAQFGGVTVVQDTQLASMCGVYSTPQAVLLDSKRRLYYKGNYNRSMFSTDARTAYAEMAIVSFIHNNPQPEFSSFAQVSYGCELPSCLN